MEHPDQSLTAPPSKDRAAINRENARKSTGPKTPEGKKRSSMNAFRHGLTGQVVVMPNDDLDAYVGFTKKIREALAPVGDLELELAHSYADARWQANHARSLRNLVLAEEATPRVELYPETNRPELNAALAIAHVALKHSRDLANFALYEQRISRSGVQAYKQLQQIQAERRKLEEQQMKEAALLYQQHEAEQLAKQEEREEIAGKPGAPPTPPYIPVPYAPAKDRIVYSIDRIKSYIDRNARLAEARSLPEPARHAAA